MIDAERRIRFSYTNSNKIMCDSFYDQLVYLLTFDAVILIVSGLRIGTLWFERTFQVFVGPIIDPVILFFIFILSLVSNALCISGGLNLQKAKFIPHLLTTPIKIILVLGLSAISFIHEDRCSIWLSSGECLGYPVVGIVWSILNIYLFVITMQCYSDIDRRIADTLSQKLFHNQILCPQISSSYSKTTSLNTKYTLIGDKNDSIISVSNLKVV